MRACVIAAALTLCAIVPAFAVSPSGVASGKGTAEFEGGATGSFDFWAAFSSSNKYLSKFKFSTPHPLGGLSWFKGSTLYNYIVVSLKPVIVFFYMTGTWNGTPAYCRFAIVDDYLGKDYVEVVIYNQAQARILAWEGVMTTGGFWVSLAP